jgi:hypothetical protein
MRNEVIEELSSELEGTSFATLGTMPLNGSRTSRIGNETGRT